MFILEVSVLAGKTVGVNKPLNTLAVTTLSVSVHSFMGGVGDMRSTTD